MIRLFALFALFAVLTLVPFSDVSAAVGSSICSGATCSQAEVGAFMAGISQACGNQGTCSLADIQTVFANVGNYILGILGALVFLAYVIGGFWFLSSGLPGVDSGKLREKGKSALRLSTLGLVIVFLAFAGLQTLKNVLTGAGVSTEDAWVSCGPGDLNSGEACGYNEVCTDEGLCVSKCEDQNPPQTSAGVIRWSQCVDTDESSTNYGFGSDVLSTGCEKNLCPGDDTIQCCSFSYTLP